MSIPRVHGWALVVAFHLAINVACFIGGTSILFADSHGID
jgi:hypothetical protein